jgi:hypothetical protein
MEILFGLSAVAAGLLGGMKLAVRPDADVPLWVWLGPMLLIALGGYLALAGNRSHLYQSNNRLAAHLADLLRSQQKPEKEQ